MCYFGLVKLALGKMALCKMEGWLKCPWVKRNWENCHVTIHNILVIPTDNMLTKRSKGINWL